MAEPGRIFPFRPWVRRADLSIVLVAAAATATIGWIGERAMWAYIALLWIGVQLAGAALEAAHFRATKFVYHVHLRKLAEELGDQRKAEHELRGVWEDIHLRDRDPYGLVRGAVQPTPTKLIKPSELPRYHA